MTERGAGLVHAQRPEIQGLRRPTEMLIVAVAGARVAAREVDKVNRNAVLNRRADDPVVGAFVILVRAKDQDGLGQRVDAEFHRVGGEDGAGRIVHLDLDAVNAGGLGGKLELDALLDPTARVEVERFLERRASKLDALWAKESCTDSNAMPGHRHRIAQ